MTGTLFLSSLLFSAVVGKIQAEDLKTRLEKISDSGQVAHLEFPGRFSSAFRWQDNSGKNEVVISEQGDSVEHYGWLPDSIWITCFRTQNGSTSIVWRIRDFSIPLQWISATHSFILTDMDNDGEKEPSFFYRFHQDGLDPLPTKLFLIRKGKKYAIRGAIPVDEEWFGYSKNPDPSIKKLPDKFQRFLHKRWDEFVATQKAQTLEHSNP